MRWGPTTDQALITWIRGRPLRTVLSITSPTRCKSNNWKSPDRGPVLPRGDWARRGHHSFADAGVLGDPPCCESVENNCACEAATSAARKLVSAWRFSFSAASSNSLNSHKYTRKSKKICHMKPQEVNTENRSECLVVQFYYEHEFRESDAPVIDM
jgi:hypothetical protein